MANLTLNKDTGVRSASILKRKKSSETIAAEIMANARTQRSSDVKSKLDIKEKDLKEQMKTLAVMKKTRKSLLEEYLSLAKEKKSTLVNEYRKVITQLKLSELISAVDVDEEKRLIFTTRPIIIKKAKWKHARFAGIYQIRVDFTKLSYSSAIDILNITQRHNEHDHPHINNTNPCWGNIGSDIELDYKDKNLYELIVDLVDYLQSGADNDGYLQFDGDEDSFKKEFTDDEKDGSENSMHAWEQFLIKAEKTPPGFCFAMYEQQKKEKNTAKVDVVRGTGTVTYTPINDLINQATLSTASTSTQLNMTGNWQYFNAVTASTSPYVNHHPVSLYHQEVARLLLELGLSEKASWHFSEYIKPNVDVLITHLELVDRGDVFWLLVHAQNPHPISARAFTDEMLSPTADLITIRPQEIQRIFVNTDDVHYVEGRQERRTVRVGFHLQDLARDEARRREHEAREREMEQTMREELAQMVVEPEAESNATLEMASRFNFKKVEEKKIRLDGIFPSPEESIDRYGIVAAAGNKNKKSTSFDKKGNVGPLFKPNLKKVKK